MQEIIDSYCWGKNKKVITFDQHGIKGLKNFAYWHLDHATDPTPLHYHSNIIEFHCLIKGKRFCQLKDSSPSIIYGNEVFITFPYEIHSAGIFAQEPVSFYAFQIDVSTPDQLLGLDSNFSYALYNLLMGLKHRHFRLSTFHISLLKKAFSCFSTYNSHTLLIGTQYLCCFLSTLDELIPLSHNHIYISEPIQKALDYIAEHYYEPIQLEQLAQITSLSLSYFKKRFKEETGVSPIDHINTIKIESAKHQLQTTTLSVTEIAFNLGFSSSSYFCSVFKKYLNISPRDYRKVNGKP